MTTTGSTTTGSDAYPYQTKPNPLDSWTFPSGFQKGTGFPVDSNGNPIVVGPEGPNPTVGYPYVDDRFRPKNPTQFGGDDQKPPRRKPTKPQRKPGQDDPGFSPVQFPRR